MVYCCLTLNRAGDRAGDKAVHLVQTMPCMNSINEWSKRPDNPDFHEAVSFLKQRK